jgi:hypothetical protein
MCLSLYASYKTFHGSIAIREIVHEGQSKSTCVDLGWSERIVHVEQPQLIQCCTHQDSACELNYGALRLKPILLQIMTGYALAHDLRILIRRLMTSSFVAVFTA